MYTEHILLIEDDPLMAKAMTATISAWGMRVERTPSAEEALQRLEDTAYDLVITDVCLPGKSGFEVLDTVLSEYSQLPVILVTGHGNVPQAVDAIRRGAFDYILKPIDPDEFEITVRRALNHGRLHRENQTLRQELASFGVEDHLMIGRSPPMQDVYTRIDKIAATDTTTLILGETGTGKELVARAVHRRSRRAHQPFIACNCAAFHASLLESELFGHEKGAFTGAASTRRGRFEEADGGTLFLDEIGETTNEFQAKLLRALQERVIERVGSSHPIPVNVRVIASTNRDLKREVAEKRFRSDLFYRINVVPILLPPLRNRGDDILELAHYFIRENAEVLGKPIPRLNLDGRDFLRSYPWPGNVRELKNAIERAVILSSSDALGASDFEVGDVKTAPPIRTLADATAEATRQQVLAALQHSGGERKAAAERLGIDRVTLYRLMKKLNLAYP
ncbi:MAG TPA: sigma-54 dependent transcriptional regulator [Kiritimatiellia bacterium]|nr:sigma-54 dependent transcriptional regulator [Kiritimatiellia bacterium]